MTIQQQPGLFERATREAFRFQSDRGELTTEQLWGLPLQHKTGFDLDHVARAVNADLKGVSEESFVSTANSEQIDFHQARLDVVKHVIAVKLAEKAAAETRAANAAKKQKLLEILGQKEDAELAGKSVDELKAEIAALG